MREDIYKKLTQIAHAQELISYDELNKELELKLDFKFRPRDRELIGIWLDEISTAEVRADRPMLSAIVGRKRANSLRQGKGFYRCARRLGLYTGDDSLKFWNEQVDRVHECWKNL